jgi:hypothetical protein
MIPAKIQFLNVTAHQCHRKLFYDETVFTDFSGVPLGNNRGSNSASCGICLKQSICDSIVNRSSSRTFIGEKNFGGKVVTISSLVPSSDRLTSP